jgi:hypothetical protein
LPAQLAQIAAPVVEPDVFELPVLPVLELEMFAVVPTVVLPNELLEVLPVEEELVEWPLEAVWVFVTTVPVVPPPLLVQALKHTAPSKTNLEKRPTINVLCRACRRGVVARPFPRIAQGDHLVAKHNLATLTDRLRDRFLLTVWRGASSDASPLSANRGGAADLDNPGQRDTTELHLDWPDFSDLRAAEQRHTDRFLQHR